MTPAKRERKRLATLLAKAFSVAFLIHTAVVSSGDTEKKVVKARREKSPVFMDKQNIST